MCDQRGPQESTNVTYWWHWRLMCCRVWRMCGTSRRCILTVHCTCSLEYSQSWPSISYARQSSSRHSSSFLPFSVSYFGNCSARHLKVTCFSLNSWLMVGTEMGQVTPLRRTSASSLKSDSVCCRHSGADLKFFGPQPHRGQSSKNMDQSHYVVWCASLPTSFCWYQNILLTEMYLMFVCKCIQDSNAGQHQQKPEALPSCRHAGSTVKLCCNKTLHF